MKINIILFGSTGHLGSHLKKELELNLNNFNVYFANKSDVKDILEDNISKKFQKKSVFINAVSVVGNANISKYSKNYINEINSQFPLKLSRLCKKVIPI